MDILEKVGELVEIITGNDKLMEEFRKDPVKAVKSVLKNVELSEADWKKLTKAVEAKIGADNAAVLLGGLKKLF